MDIRFTPHNTHKDGIKAFDERDPQLRVLASLPLVHHPALLDKLPRENPGIYTLGGGRQIGKTTLLKQWMKLLISCGTPASNISFFTGELIDDHHALVRLLDEELSEMRSDSVRYLIIDEISYIQGWDRGIKYLADAGLLEDTILMISGSDLSFLKETRMHFPGRRGKAEQTDFHLYPLSFYEFLKLKNSIPDIRAVLRSSELSMEILFALLSEFEQYLLHGGYLTAINDVAQTGTINASTLSVYHEWIRGDVLKRGKQENYLREILHSAIRRFGSQLTWNALSKELSIDHPKTVSDYFELLVSMDAVFIQSALREDVLGPAPKKAKKIAFTDPFIYHSIFYWLNPSKRPFEEQIKPSVMDPALSGRLTEACVAVHFSRLYPTFYVKAEGEVDIAYVHNDRFFPIEVKWTGQLRPKDLKQIRKYSNGVIWSRSQTVKSIGGVPVEFLPLALARLAAGGRRRTVAG